MTVDVERIGRILVISIQREEKRNALNAEITAAVDAAMNELEDNPDLWCGVLTGTATVFSAGADLGAGTGGPDAPRRRGRLGPAEPHEAAHRRGRGLRGRWRDGAGALVRPRRRVEHGVVRTPGGEARAHARLRRDVPQCAAASAQRGARAAAHRRVLVGGTCRTPRLRQPHHRAGRRARAEALALAEQVCANAPLAVQSALASANEVLGSGEDTYWATSDRLHQALVDTEDSTEGIAAFFERRPPVWKNR